MGDVGIINKFLEIMNVIDAVTQKPECVVLMVININLLQVF